MLFPLMQIALFKQLAFANNKKGNAHFMVCQLFHDWHYPYKLYSDSLTILKYFRWRDLLDLSYQNRTDQEIDQENARSNHQI